MTRPFLTALRGIALTLCLLAADLAESQTEADEAKRRLHEVTRQLDSLDIWLEEADNRLSGLQAGISRSDEEIDAINRRIRQLRMEITETGHALAELEDRRQEVEQCRVEQAGRIAGHVRAAHRLLGSGFFKMLLNRESPDSVDRIVRYHRHLVQARIDAIDAYANTLAEIDEMSRATHEREQALAAQQDELKSRTALLGERRRERAGLVGSLLREMEDKTVARDQLARDRKRLEGLLTEIVQQLSDPQGAVFIASKGRMQWPVMGRVVHRFGDSRADGRMRWEGIYLAAPDGTRIHAIHSGRVVFADWLRGFGLLTIIDHGDRHMTLYGNADTLLKQAGQWVEGGEPIASAGRSGGGEVSGLYFEVRVNGRPSNPTAWLRGRAPR